MPSAAEYQGEGLATMLLGQLADAAAATRNRHVRSGRLTENRRMLGVLRESGFPVETHDVARHDRAYVPDVADARGTGPLPASRGSSAANALRRVLYPQAVAVIGASERRGAVGAAVMRNLLAAGFPGPIYPVNPRGGTIQSLPAFASVEDIARSRRSGHHRRAGDARAGGGRAMRAQRRARPDRAHRGLRRGRSRGPTPPGGPAAHLSRLWHADDRSKLHRRDQHRSGATLNATFGPLMPPAGRIGMATQSGALGLAAIDFTTARELGFSSLVSMGNKADISGNDLLGYWQTDPRTDVVLLYLESFGNPRKFARIARALGKTKPIVALKSGRSAVGARATASHTGALLWASDVTVDALFRQSGVIRTDTLDEMLDVAELLVHQPLPTGGRVAILTNAGGPAVMCADSCEAQGLEVPPLVRGDASTTTSDLAA